MSAELNPTNLDDAIRLYLAGDPEKEILSTTGVSKSTLHRERSRRGIPPRREFILPIDDIVNAYQFGESEYSLAQRFHVSRNVIRRRLEGAGIQIRTMSEAGLVRAAQMSAEQRSSQAAPSHAAIRGSKRTEGQLLRRAQLIEQRGTFGSPGEKWLHDSLASYGLKPIPQKAIGKYNVDLAIAPIAMEVLGGGWHLTKRHHSIRTPQILNSGWSLLFIWNQDGPAAMSKGAPKYVVSYIEEVSRDPSLVGEYRVISGNGKLLAAGRSEDNEFPLVPPPRGPLNARA